MPTIDKHQAVTLRQLRVLCAIVEAGNLSAAARRLRVTAPAVSMQLRLLEEHLGAKLVERGHDGNAAATVVGREVLGTAAQIEAILSSCAQRIAAIQAGFEGRVSLGAVSTAKYFAPQLVGQLRRQAPRVAIAFLIGNRQETVAALQNRQIELAIMGRPPREPQVEADLLGDHPHVLIGPPGHPLVGRRETSPGDLADCVFLVREPGSGTRMLMERFFEQVGLEGRCETIEFGSNETIKQAVMAGLGLAVLSAHTVHAELADGRLAELPFAGFPIVREWYLVHRRDTALAPAARHVRDVILSMGGSYLPGASARE